jgi:hypothetical protein
MKTKLFSIFLFVILFVGLSHPLSAQTINATGTWKADIDTPIGLFKYILNIQQDGEKLTGKILHSVENEKSEVVLEEGKIKGDLVSFVESFSMQDQVIKITYSGKITANEMQLSRQVGEFATEQVTFKREVSASAQ